MDPWPDKVLDKSHEAVVLVHSVVHQLVSPKVGNRRWLSVPHGNLSKIICFLFRSFFVAYKDNSMPPLQKTCQYFSALNAAATQTCTSSTSQEIKKSKNQQILWNYSKTFHSKNFTIISKYCWFFDFYLSDIQVITQRSLWEVRPFVLPPGKRTLLSRRKHDSNIRIEVNHFFRTRISGHRGNFFITVKVKVTVTRVQNLSNMAPCQIDRLRQGQEKRMEVPTLCVLRTFPRA